MPPTYSVPSIQLLSGDECHSGIAISVRSSRCMDSASAEVMAVVQTLRWLSMHPLGRPVVPEV